MPVWLCLSLDARGFAASSADLYAARSARPGPLGGPGFLFARKIGHPVRESDAATRHELEGNRMHDDHCQNLKRPNWGACGTVMTSSNGRGSRITTQAATGSRDREPPKTYDDEWGLPQGRHRPPCSGQISH